MAWLKFDVTTPEKPEVLAITVAMGWDDPDLTVGKLLKVWRWFDQHTVDGNAKSVTPALLDRLIGVTGLTQAIADSGWLVIHSGGLTLPNFETHNGKTAKDRALTASRVAKSKSNAKGNASTVTEPLAREEKRREEKKVNTEGESATHSTPSQPVPAKQKAEAIAKPDDVEQQTWADWCQLRKAKKATVSSTVIDGARDEAGKAGMSLEAFLKVWCLRGSQGLEASWLKPEERKQSTPLNKQQALEQRNRDVAEQFLKSRGFQNAPI